MPVIDETVVIACPAGEVFDFPGHAENLPRWDSSMFECLQAGSSPVTVGTRYRRAGRILGRNIVHYRGIRGSDHREMYRHEFCPDRL